MDACSTYTSQENNVVVSSNCIIFVHVKEHFALHRIRNIVVTLGHYNHALLAFAEQQLLLLLSHDFYCASVCGVCYLHYSVCPSPFRLCPYHFGGLYEKSFIITEFSVLLSPLYWFLNYITRQNSNEIFTNNQETDI